MKLYDALVVSHRYHVYLPSRITWRERWKVRPMRTLTQRQRSFGSRYNLSISSFPSDGERDTNGRWQREDP